jgi:prolipoprotein diacylglyceryltransferase
MAWYGLQRFLLDFLRVGDAAIGPISWNQLSGLVAGLFGIAMYWRLGRRRPTDERAMAALGTDGGTRT